MNELGETRIFPFSYTSLHFPAIGWLSAEGGIVASVEDLLSLKEFVDRLPASGRNEDRNRESCKCKYDAMLAEI